MTAYRVVTDHGELENSGVVTHSQLDAYVNTSPWLVVSGAAGSVPPSARRLVAGPGIAIVDGGPGGDLTISASGTGNTISWNEVLSGSVDGVNGTFGLMFTPLPTAALMLFVNGVKQREGASSDFVLSGTIVTFVNGALPRSGSNVDATYPH